MTHPFQGPTSQTMALSSFCWAQEPKCDPDGPGAEYLMTLVPTTMKGMVVGTRFLIYRLLEPSGLIWALEPTCESLVVMWHFRHYTERQQDDRKGQRPEVPQRPPVNTPVVPQSGLLTIGFKKLQHGCRMTYAGYVSFVGLGLEDGRVLIFWHLL